MLTTQMQRAIGCSQGFGKWSCQARADLAILVALLYSF